MIIHGEKIELATETTHDRIIDKCLDLHKKNPKNLAFVTAENEKDCISYQQLHDYSIALSEWFVENGYKKGDVVLLAVHNNYRFVIALLGAWRAGLIVSAASYQFTSFEMRYQLEDSTAKLVFVDKITQPVVVEAMKGLNVRHVVSFEQQAAAPAILFSSTINKPTKNIRMPHIDMSDVMYLPYSSGTTGKPKGVMITHQNCSIMLTASCKKFAEIAAHFGLPEDFGAPYDLQFLPLYHAMGMFRTITTCYRGTTQIVFTHFSMELVLKMIEKYTITALALVPAILVRLINSPLIKKYNISSLMNITIGSAPLPEGAVIKLKQLFPKMRIIQGYGMTELTFASHLPGPGSPEGSVGRVIPGVSMKVKKDNGELCGVKEVGECWIRGPSVMKGYWGKPELTKELLDEDGYMRTGDVVYFDENGDTYICDRIKELIKVNAKQVAPAELESVLLEHEDVADVCVFGVDDAMSGEKPIAYIVPKKRTDLETAKSIINFINHKLARYKHIKELEFVKEIARTGTGKILRRQMKQMYLDSKKSKL